MSAQEHTVYRYGDFPELFWDLRREAPVDAQDPVILARLLLHARPETLWKLVPVQVLLEKFDDLELPEHSRNFWSLVVEELRDQRTRRRQPA